MQYRTVGPASEKGEIKLCAQAVHLPQHLLSQDEQMGILQVSNISDICHQIHMCPLYIGMRVWLRVNLSAKDQVVQGAAGQPRA
eukprot:7073440-Pyramimonas_sp.AAC.1